MQISLRDLLSDLDETPHGSVAAVEACLDRIDDPSGEGGRAFIKSYRDQALSLAAASDARRAAGEPGRLLEGMPISIKDLFDVAGESTTAGSTIRAAAPAAPRDAIVVERLRAAGAIIVGKTNMTEFAYSGLGLNPHYGTPRNPFDPARIPGGSSSGAGVAGPYGFAAASIGTDTGGSVRIPAAFCGVVGFKPTQRRVPLAGVYPLSPSLDSVGPLAATVECCNRLDAVMAGGAFEPLADIPLNRPRFAIPEATILTETLDPAVASAFDRAVDILAAAGATIGGRPFAEFKLAAEINALGGIAPPEAFATHRATLSTHGRDYDPHVRQRLQRAARIPPENYSEAVKLRSAAIDAFRRSSLEFDALLCPTVAVVPPRFDAVSDPEAYVTVNNLVLRNTSLFNLLDCCAVTIPCQRDGDLPVGLMLVARGWTDRRLLAVAHAIEGILRRHQ